MSTPALAVLISGGGRTALNIHRVCESGALAARVALVIAHREDIAGVERCRAAGMRVAVLPDGADLSDRIDRVLEAASIDLVCLAGYLRHFRVGSRWRGRTLNIHPGLLPQFGGHGMYGTRVHRAVLAAQVKESGCTVHEVDEIYDHGAVVLEQRCAVHADDTPDTLAARVFALECDAYPRAIGIMLDRARARNQHPEGVR